MLNAKLEAALNDQINRELYSGYLYLAMAAYFDDKGLKGFSHWMRVQHREEENHGLMMFGYVAQAGGRVALKAIDAPTTTWASPLAVFEEVLEHEQQVTRWIHELVDLAQTEKDHATLNFLQWFVKEQVEEEEKAKEAVDTLKLIGEGGPALLMYDRELGARIFTVPPEATTLGVV